MKKLDYKRMTTEINELVDNDWAYDIQLKRMPKSTPYTQKEARDMADRLTDVYVISHCVYCTPCQRKYIKT